MVLPDWFNDKDIKGGRVLSILRKHELDPEDQFGRHVLLEIMGFRQYSSRENILIRNPWGLFVRLCRMAAYGDPKPLTWSAEAEDIRDRLAKFGTLRP